MKIETFKENCKKVLYNASAVAAPVVCAASMALTVSAAEGGVDYSAATTALQSGFSDVATQIVTVAGVCITAGIGIFGLKKLVTTAMGFFSKVVGR